MRIQIALICTYWLALVSCISLLNLDNSVGELAKRRGGGGGSSGRGGGAKGGSSSGRGSGSSGSGSSSNGRGSGSSSNGEGSGSSSNGAKGGSSGSSGRGSAPGTQAPKFAPSTRTGPSISPTRPYNSRYPFYYGGSLVPFYAGAAILGVVPLLLLTSAVSSYYPGYWGPHGVYEYNYPATTENGTNYDVHCYCIEFRPCSCAGESNATYMNNLPTTRYRVNNTGNGTQTNPNSLYINGSLDGDEDKGTELDSAASTLLVNKWTFNTIFVSILLTTVL